MDDAASHSSPQHWFPSSPCSPGVFVLLFSWISFLQSHYSIMVFLMWQWLHNTSLQLSLPLPSTSLACEDLIRSVHKYSESLPSRHLVGWSLQTQEGLVLRPFPDILVNGFSNPSYEWNEVLLTGTFKKLCWVITVTEGICPN